MLQRVVMNRAWPKPLTGVSSLTAADHLISPAITQAWAGPRPRGVRSDLSVKSKVFSKLRPQKSELDGDGEGFDTKTNGHGMGIRIMSYRAQCIGGSCEVYTGASTGTTVYCRVPLEAQPSLSTI
jgi:hypothetical protein